MGKRKRSRQPRQGRHKVKGNPSRFDRRDRLTHSNPKRKKTRAPKVALIGFVASMASELARLLDARMGFRLPIILSGMLLAGNRRAASAWFQSAGVKDDWDRFYECLISVGRLSRRLALAVLRMLVERLDLAKEGVIRTALDDSPTERYGRYVEGAGVHHNPTPGPADGEWLYGHNWVSLCLLVRHRLWGVLALPVLSRLYVRQVDVPKLQAKYPWKFQTKHELALDMVIWLWTELRWINDKLKLWLAVDGAYAAAPLLKPLIREGVVVFSRLRKDAHLNDLPPEGTKRGRGRRRIYGPNRISLSKRAAAREGWESMTFNCRGVEVTRQCKTFLATSRLVSGVIRVVIVRFDDGGWAPYFCTDPNVAVQDVLEMVADRWAIEEQFHDIKEVWGAGEQQVRNVWSNIGCWHLNQWMYTLVELASWSEEKGVLCDRSDRPWDNPDRRPSHADRRRAIAKEMLRKQFLSALPAGPDLEKFRRAVVDLISLSA